MSTKSIADLLELRDADDAEILAMLLNNHGIGYVVFATTLMPAFHAVAHALADQEVDEETIRKIRGYVTIGDVVPPSSPPAQDALDLCRRVLEIKGLDPLPWDELGAAGLLIDMMHSPFGIVEGEA